MSFDIQLSRIIGVHDTKEQISLLQNLIDELVPTSSKKGSEQSAVNNIHIILLRLLSDEVSQQVTRVIIIYLAKAIENLPSSIIEEVLLLILTAIKQSNNSYDEADFLLRKHLFECYVSSLQFKSAAQTLAGVNFESTIKVLTAHEKADIYVKCAEAFLEDDETVDAEVMVNKASVLMHEVADIDLPLQLRYRVTYARILDSNRKFIEASLRYYELSNTVSTEIVAADLISLLGKAVTCAILGKAGAQRSRVLGVLCKDDRLELLQQLPDYSSHPSILLKTHNQQLLSEEELEVFEAVLLPHQKALTPDGFTLLRRAVIEHNLIAVSHIYDNIYFSELAALLKLPPRVAEKLAGRMIAEERLAAAIDQPDALLLFGHPPARQSLLELDGVVQSLCGQVADCAELIQAMGR